MTTCKVHSNLFLVNEAVDDSLFALLILNCDGVDRSTLMTTWKVSRVHVCCDGGANRLFDALEAEEREKHTPQVIIGDLDSLREDVRYFYEERGTAIVHRADQDSNDLQKGLTYLKDKLIPAESLLSTTVILLGGLGGRFDHEMATISVLFEWKGLFYRTLTVDASSTTELLEENVDHRIVPVRNSRLSEGFCCGLLPLGGRVDSATTSGLMWNLQEQALEMGGLISSSNRIRDDCDSVSVRASHAVIWTCSRRHVSES